MYKKADWQNSVMAYLGHVLMENRHGLLVNACRSHGHRSQPVARYVGRSRNRSKRRVGGDIIEHRRDAASIDCSSEPPLDMAQVLCGPQFTETCQSARVVS